MLSRNIVFFLFILLIKVEVFSQKSLNTESPSAFGKVELSKGFDAPFQKVRVETLSKINVQNLNFCVDCEGYLGDISLVDLIWEGETDQLRVHFEPVKFGTDASLAIYTPDRQWLYVDNMDMGQDGPFLNLYGYNSGLYKIYIGTKKEGASISGEIIITEKAIKEESVFKDGAGLDAPFVPTPNSIVNYMMNIADVKPGDYVVDLGCGDGRLVIEAAKRGAYAFGVDLDPERIKESWENAKADSVTDKVFFEVKNLFDADLSQVSVISSYLFEKVNVALAPKFLELRPGTRIVSHAFKMGEWLPDKSVTKDCITVHFWVVPDKIQGDWSWKIDDTKFNMKVDQKYQKIQTTITENDALLTVAEQILSGSRISLLLSNPFNGKKYAFNGLIDGDIINGTVKVTSIDGKALMLPWKANQ
jgi:SAM-dependent methyltransferase